MENRELKFKTAVKSAKKFFKASTPGAFNLQIEFLKEKKPEGKNLPFPEFTLDENISIYVFAAAAGRSEE